MKNQRNNKGSLARMSKSLRNLRNQDKGHSFVPRKIVLNNIRPWFQASIPIDITDNEVSITVDQLRTNLLSYVMYLTDVKTAPHFEVKVKSVTVYGSNNAQDDLAIACYDLSDVDENVKEVIFNTTVFSRNTNIQPCIGYEWPISQQSQVIDSQQASGCNIVDLSYARHIRFKLMFRFRVVGE